MIVGPVSYRMTMAVVVTLDRFSGYLRNTASRKREDSDSLKVTRLRKCDIVKNDNFKFIFLQKNYASEKAEFPCIYSLTQSFVTL